MEEQLMSTNSICEVHFQKDVKKEAYPALVFRGRSNNILISQNDQHSIVET